MDTIKYQVNGIFEIIFGCLSDIINSITSFFDYLLIEREFVVVCLLLIMFVIAVPIAVYLWDESKEKETSKSQKIKFFKSFILMILSFVFVVLFYIGISNFYINSNLTTEIDDVVLVEDGISDSKVMDDGDFEFATGGFKFFSKRGYSVNWFDYRNVTGGNAIHFNKAYFGSNHIKDSKVVVDIPHNLKSNESRTNIRFKYYFYKKGSRIPRIIVVESK